MHNKSFKASSIAMSLTAALLIILPGCSDKAPTPPQSAASPSDVLTPARRNDIVKRIASEAKGITYGQKSGKIAYVFFDPKCTHCGDLWHHTESFKTNMSFVWIPVSILGQKSNDIGSTILGSANPLEALEKNESNIRSHGDGIPVDMALVDAHKGSIETNTKLLTSLVPEYPISSVPFTVFSDGTDNVELFAGAVDKDALSRLFKIEQGDKK
jgi:thiol:disulfide interchange protein DsbG